MTKTIMLALIRICLGIFCDSLATWRQGKRMGKHLPGYLEGNSPFRKKAVPEKGPAIWNVDQLWHTVPMTATGLPVNESSL